MARVVIFKYLGQLTLHKTQTKYAPNGAEHRWVGVVKFASAVN